MEKIIIAQLRVKENSIAQFLELAAIMVKNSTAEKGCLVYRLFTEVAMPTEFFVYEKYINQDAIVAHRDSEHYKTFLTAVVPLLSDKPVIDVY